MTARKPTLPKALEDQLTRLGFSVSNAAINGELDLGPKVQWLAHLAPPTGVFRAGDAVRGLRFCRPFSIASELRRGERDIVLGVTPGHWLTVPAAREGPVHFVRCPHTDRPHAEKRALATLLAQLTPDAGHPPLRVARDPVDISPVLEALVIASLAEAGVHDVAPGALGREEVGGLRALRVEHLASLAELDGRFTSLEALRVRAVEVEDVGGLERLPALRRLMLDRCVVAQPAGLAKLTALTELHLPSCLLDEAQLGVLRELPKLGAVTLAGNRLGPSARALIDALPSGRDPAGTSDASLALNARLAARKADAAAVVRKDSISLTARAGGPIFVSRQPASASEGELFNEARNVERLQRPDGTLEAMLAWPATRRHDPTVELSVPDEILALLSRLGARFEPVEALPPGLTTATERHLAQLVWPQRTYATAGDARIAMKDFRPSRLRDFHGRCLGAFDADQLLIVITPNGGPDPHVRSRDPEEPEAPGVTTTYPLSSFLRSLQ